MGRDTREWTADLVKQHFDAVLDDLGRRMAERFEAEARAQAERSNALEGRLVYLNELRGGVITRGEYAAALGAAEEQHRAIYKEIEINRERIGGLMPRLEYNAQHQALVDRVENGWKEHRQIDDVRFDAIDKRLEKLATESQTGAGRRSGYGQVWQIAVGLAGIIYVIVSLYLILVHH